MSISAETCQADDKTRNASDGVGRKRGGGASRAWGGQLRTEYAVSAIVFSAESIARRRDLWGKEYSLIALQMCMPFSLGDGGWHGVEIGLRLPLNH